AHSWVEVYVPKVGWMPFEPTIGFEGFEQLEEEKASDTAPKTEDAKKEKEEKKKQEEKKAQNEKEEKIQEKQLKKEKEAQKQPEKKEENKASITWLWWTLAAIGLLVVTILFNQRRKIMPTLLIWYYNKKNPSLSKAYEKVVSRLDKQLGLKREDGETLHGYAMRVDSYLKTNDFSTLTSYMEQELYNPDAELAKWIDFKECWENLINQTRG
ncbi:MAG: transglutaminase family protein, partial [Kurthia sp.]